MGFRYEGWSRFRPIESFRLIEGGPAGVLSHGFIFESFRLIEGGPAGVLSHGFIFESFRLIEGGPAGVLSHGFICLCVSRLKDPM